MKIKRILAVVCILALSISFIAGCTKNEEKIVEAPVTENPTKTEGSTGKPLEGEHYVIAMSASFKNFETVVVGADGKESYEGLDIDFIDQMAEDMGFTYEILNMSFSGLIGALQANRADFVVSGMSATDERRKNVDFSDGYIDSREAFLVQKDSGIETVEDLTGKTISCSIGTSYEDLARAIPEATVTTFDGQPAVLQELLIGRTDVMVTDGSLLDGFIKEYPELDGFMLPKDSDLNKGVTKQFGIAFPKGSELVEVFNEEIQTLKENGIMDEIIVKWLGEAYIGE